MLLSTIRFYHKLTNSHWLRFKNFNSGKCTTGGRIEQIKFPTIRMPTSDKILKFLKRKMLLSTGPFKLNLHFSPTKLHYKTDSKIADKRTSSEAHSSEQRTAKRETN